MEKKQNKGVKAFLPKEEYDHTIMNKSNIGQSGNSDVDVNVNVEIETVSIAYAMLCSLWARNQMTDLEFERAINKFEQLRNKSLKKDRDERADSNKHIDNTSKESNLDRRLFRLL